jgi:hypothetical protein
MFPNIFTKVLTFQKIVFQNQDNKSDFIFLKEAYKHDGKLVVYLRAASTLSKQWHGCGEI